MYLQTDLKTFDLKTLGVKFDVILIEPPLEVRTRYNKLFCSISFFSTKSIFNLQEYFRGGSALGAAGAQKPVFWNWDEIQSLEINEIGIYLKHVYNEAKINI